jgi:hypothetical protein
MEGWSLITNYVGNGRTATQCNQRWCRVIDPAINHKQWSPEEDARLLAGVKTFGETRWSQIAKTMVGRTDLQCRYRYIQITRGTKWSNEEEKTTLTPPEASQVEKRKTVEIRLFGPKIPSLVSQKELLPIRKEPDQNPG